jgi:hypothetical protein
MCGLRGGHEATAWDQGVLWVTGLASLQHLWLQALPDLQLLSCGQTLSGPFKIVPLTSNYCSWMQLIMVPKASRNLHGIVLKAAMKSVLHLKTCTRVGIESG